MSIFSLYLKLGFQHIVDLNGYDHILFIISLCGIYYINEWKKVLVLVTAFTLGHSVTLALASLQILIFPTDIIEFLIPLTIFITAIGNILYKGENMSKRMHNLKYVLAMFFGLIHGLGFSNYLRSLLGMEGNLVKPLFAFNIGLEIGQITIVMCILLMSFLFHRVMNTKHREWNLVISGAAAGISFILMLERWPW